MALACWTIQVFSTNFSLDNDQICGILFVSLREAAKKFFLSGMATNWVGDSKGLATKKKNFLKALFKLF